MKKVFEGNLIYHCGSVIVDDSILDLLLQDFSGNRVRITVEDLPESKPDKNCGNCLYTGNTRPRNTPCENCGTEDLPNWTPVPKEPKPAEPQGWEQRFDKEFGFLGDDRHESCTVIQDLKAFIRAEIERVREEEKQAIINHLSGAVKDVPATSDLTRLVAAAIRLVIMAIEQNKHREGGE